MLGLHSGRGTCLLLWLPHSPEAASETHVGHRKGHENTCSPKEKGEGQEGSRRVGKAWPCA